jgi:hypothetical protein
MACHFHSVCAAVSPQFQDVTPLPYGDDCSVSPEPCRVHTYDDRGAAVLGCWPLHGIIDQIAADELIVTF